MRRLSILKFLNNKFVAYILAGIFLVLSIILGISIGTISVPILTIMKIISAKLFGFISLETIDPMYSSIVLSIRLPRVILSGLVGASLAIAGAAFQGLLRNPLADPYTLGVSSGASVGAVLTLFFQLSIPFIGSFTLPLLSILFSFFTIFLVLTFASKIERTLRVETIILTGIIFSSFLGAIISLMIALTGDELRQIIGWLLGSVSMRGWDYIKIILPFFVIGSCLLIFNAKELNAMSFGEERAQHLGVNVHKKKLIILTAGSILTGAAVAVSGTIGFVGLVIPHLSRLLWGSNHCHLLPLSIITGSGFLILADLISRTIISPTELPIGVITALIGAPIFGIILLQRKKMERSG
ncbi:iron ABC transporter permease [Bacillus sp. sid0103]|uniref:FecCD family ABC transporter permease n=1 Tax=Bacillus sp. sid0103 TaxID=2856337 RepID=UPI001C44654A|nr:iron chelate uptake ABC transporter family permease subunit [Bacillus sp. sid0103]MBV7504659.1 iron ABC transporter permease [Bacillus sp. sid0103]